MEFRTIAFLFIAGLIVLDAIITYYTFRRTEKEIEELKDKVCKDVADLWVVKAMVDFDSPILHTNVEHVAEMKRDINRIREEIKVDSEHISTRLKQLEKTNAPKIENADNKHNKHKKN